jgi:hypothetical protein
MLIVPLRVSETEFGVFLILEKDNVERIKQYDPIELAIEKIGPPYSALKMTFINILYATKEDLVVFHDLVKHGDLRAAIKHLSRGFKFKPSEGDHDLKYQSIKPKVN